MGLSDIGKDFKEKYNNVEKARKSKIICLGYILKKFLLVLY
jgi:hypothetical protein